MTWEQIPGWVDDHIRAEYDAAIARAPATGVVFVEIGVAFGKSLAYAASRIVASGKPIVITGIDPWEADWIDRDFPELVARAGSQQRACVDALAANLTREELSVLVLERSTSVEAAARRADESIDFVFIDGDHTEEGVRADLEAWWPKVRAGGVIAGHDHTPSFPGVELACIAFFGQRFASPLYQVNGSCWRRTKP